MGVFSVSGQTETSAKRGGSATPDRGVRKQAWPHRFNDAAEMAEGRFRFLYQERVLWRQSANPVSDPRRLDVDWNVDASRLWRFHLQCHEYLLELGDHDATVSQALIRSWLDEPSHRWPQHSPDAWHPFCISRRLPVWLCYAAIHGLPDDLVSAFWRSVTDQLAWLRGNLEWDLGGNHLLENLCALTLGDRLLEAEIGKLDLCVDNQVKRQLTEQILSHGEHYERSPTYHALMLVCVLQMAEATEAAGDNLHKELVDNATKMSSFLQSILHANGSIPLLGDAAIDETPVPQVLETWTLDTMSPLAARNRCGPDHSVQVQKQSSPYWVVRPRRGDSFCFDMGEVGCDHLPAHAHCDLLQLIASYSGRPVIVDTGNFDYEKSQMREQCRSTSAHNVLQVDDAEQCDVWPPFRMGRRGHILERKCGRHGKIQWAMATHDGFSHIGVRESGRLVFCDDSSLSVVDWICARQSHQLTTRIHFHPDFNEQIESMNPDANEIEIEGRKISFRAYSHPQSEDSPVVKISSSVYCPSFGVLTENRVLELTTNVNLNAQLDYSWIGWRMESNPSDKPTHEISEVQWSDRLVTVHLANGPNFEIPRGR